MVDLVKLKAAGKANWRQLPEYVRDVVVTKTLDALFAEVSANHWVVSSFFEFPDGLWHCSLLTLDRPAAIAYADGKKAAGALQAAMNNLRALIRHLDSNEAAAESAAWLQGMAANIKARAKLDRALQTWR